MAEAAGLVLAVVGLAGQILESCEAIRNLIDDVKKANDDLRLFCSTADQFESSIRTFRTLLQHLTQSNVPVISSDHCSHVEDVLNFSNEIIHDAVQFIRKGKFSDGIRSTLRFVWQRDPCASHIARIKDARERVNLVYAELSLYLQNHTNQHLNGIGLTLGASSTALATVSTNLTAGQRHTVNSITASHSNILTRFDALPAQINQGQRDTQNVISGFRNEVMNILSELRTSQLAATSTVVSGMREQAPESDQHTQDTRSATSTPFECSATLRLLTPNIVERVKGIFSGVLADFDYDTKSDVEAIRVSAAGGDAHLNEPRKAITQYKLRREYQRSIGLILVEVIITVPNEPGKDESRNLRIRRPIETLIRLNLKPRPDFLAFCVLCTLKQRGIRVYIASVPERLLRVYNSVDSHAPIVRACKNGDLAHVRHLFKEGLASPYDRICGTNEPFAQEPPYQSLLDVVLQAAYRPIARCYNKGHYMPLRGQRHMTTADVIEAYNSLFEEFLYHGLDPGEAQQIRIPHPFPGFPYLKVFLRGGCFSPRGDVRHATHRLVASIESVDLEFILPQGTETGRCHYLESGEAAGEGFVSDSHFVEDPGFLTGYGSDFASN